MEHTHQWIPVFDSQDDAGVAHWYACNVEGCSATQTGDVEEPERESESSKHCDAGYMNDMRFGAGDGPDY